MKGQSHRWYSVTQQREQERAALERHATKIIRKADHQLRRRSPPPRAARPLAPVLPQRLTLDDLPLLRRKGLVP